MDVLVRLPPEKTNANPTPADVRRVFNSLGRFETDETEEKYAEYLGGGCLLRSVVVNKLPTVELLHSSDIKISYRADAICRHCLQSDHEAQIVVERLSREPARNYMGWNEERRCYVFKGQRRLLGDFLEKTADLLREGQMERVQFHAQFVEQPIEGHNPDLTYDQFADYVEFWVCAVYLQPGLKDPLKLDHVATLLKVSPADMCAPQAYGLLVPLRDEEEQKSETEPEEGESAEEDRAARGVAAAGQRTRGRYALRRRSSSVKYI
ncbi:hypothetical protein E4U54_001761 [Claviceps lovelessii]|nr:hypothetical protein E4U54_001761 [Claviceps lovelessii]